MAATSIPANPQKSVTAVTAQTDSMFEHLDRSRLIREPMAAEILCLETDTLRKLRKRGRGPAFVQLGRSIFYRLQDIEVFIDRHLQAVSNA